MKIELIEADRDESKMEADLIAELWKICEVRRDLQPSGSSHILDCVKGLIDGLIAETHCESQRAKSLKAERAAHEKVREIEIALQSTEYTGFRRIEIVAHLADDLVRLHRQIITGVFDDD